MCFTAIVIATILHTLVTPTSDKTALYSMMGTPDETVSSAVYRVAVRSPNFWPDRQAAWFAQGETQFELASITHQRTKFNYVVSQLNKLQAAEVEDIITTPPEQEPYDRLKAQLVRLLSTSREQLLSYEEMGDRMPPQFLLHLKSLAPEVPDAPSGPAGSHRTCKPFLPARLRAVSIQPHTTRTEFARLVHCLPQ